MKLGRGKVINLGGKAKRVQTTTFDKNLQPVDLFLAHDNKIANSLLLDLTWNISS